MRNSTSTALVERWCGNIAVTDTLLTHSLLFAEEARKRRQRKLLRHATRSCEWAASLEHEAAMFLSAYKHIASCVGVHHSVCWDICAHSNTATAAVPVAALHRFVAIDQLMDVFVSVMVALLARIGLSQLTDREDDEEPAYVCKQLGPRWLPPM